ncbi:hypothetical protein HMPREF1624_05123 [Sporothrix schenckii ATCC 58251]|uniref:Transcription factor RfeG n=1 Tax=Sporothrix schenckii (strain ATCC 58251 / de Perez 2211183) TaxID=1391915 RepID=U7PUA8_SPOS1|nr:hypothetical protein HMPREF1624_05123 [Sporothrix schenckii ATCC 58251]
MANRGRGAGASYPPSNNAPPRQNEYFVPRDGIDREVITADICRYLGNDALVRPGTHTNDSGRVIQGYFITAYRNLTSAMIADLKTDSARWDAERRKSQSGAGTLAYSHRDRLHDRVHDPNSPSVKYQDSQIRDGPQRGGNVNIPVGGGNGGGAPYGGLQSSYGGNSAGNYDNGPRYPGSEAPGYSASGPGGPGPGSYGPPGGHGGYNNAPYAQGGLPPQAQYSSQQQSPQDPRYGGPPPQVGGLGGIGGTYGGPIGGAGHPQPHGQDGYASGAHYAVVSNRDAYSMDMHMTDAPLAPARRNSPPSGPGGFGNQGNSSRGSYGSGAPGTAGGYGGYSAPPPPASHAAAYAQPIDGGYGRAPNANTGYSPAHDVSPQPPHAQHREQRAASERSDHRDRPERPSERERERERDATPPNRNGPPPKSGSAAPHHLYGRR